MVLFTGEIWSLNSMSVIYNGKEILFHFLKAILNCENEKTGIIYTECFAQVSKEHTSDVYLPLAI